MQTLPRQLCSPKLTGVQPCEQVIHVRDVVRDLCVGCRFWKKKKIPTGVMPASPHPLSADNPRQLCCPQTHRCSSKPGAHPCPAYHPGRHPGPLFWVPLLEEEENPHAGNASFPTPARGKHPPASSAAPNSPLFIQVRRALKSVMSSWMSELVVAAGKARTSPVRQWQLSHSHPVRTACRPLCSRQTHHLIPALRCCR